MDDLEMVKRVFFDGLKNELKREEHEVLQGNWKDLQVVAKNFYKDLRSARHDPTAVAQCVVTHIPNFNAFLDFCSKQQACLDLVEHKSKHSPSFFAAYTECTQHPAARGLPLSYYILIPMTRVIRYPLLVDKIIKYADKESQEKREFETAVNRLRGLCREAEQIVSQFESLQMGHWCQFHVKCEAIKPNLVFNSQTHSQGPRVFLHSGVMQKARTGRVLIALLFNDILLLTTPDEQIDHPSSFKLSRSSDTELTLYRSPILLEESSIVSGAPPEQRKSSTAGSQEEDQSFSLLTPKFAVHLKATSMTAKTLWFREISKAIDSAKVTAKADSQEDAAGAPPAIGRILLEVMPPQGLHIPQGYAGPPGTTPRILLRIQCDGQKFTAPTTLAKAGGGSSKPNSPQDERVSTQIVIRNLESMLNVSFLLQQQYAPDLNLGMVMVSLQELLQAAGFSRNPSLRQFPLTGQIFPSPDGSSPSVVLKYVFHMLE